MEAAEEAHHEHEENPELQVRTEKKSKAKKRKEKRKGKRKVTKERKDGASLGTLSRGWGGAVREGHRRPFK